MSFLLIIAGPPKQHKRMPQKVFHANIKALGYFLGMVCVCSIRGFPWISGRSLIWTTSVVHDRRLETLETLNKLHIAVMMYLAKHIICNITKLLLSTNAIAT